MDFESLYRQTVEELFREQIPGATQAAKFCLGQGKHIRPKLLLDAAEIWGADREAAGRAAVGIELLHHYLLVHDDLMDGDELRRGQPTLHLACAQEYGLDKGRGLAVAIGDQLANEALSQLAHASHDPAMSAALVSAALEVNSQTILGQIREYVPSISWTVEDLEKFYAYKTAAYSIALPWQLADILSGADKNHAALIAEAARDLGIAYQFHDDLIEFRGEKMRDAAGRRSDLARGKITIITCLLLEHLSGFERQKLAQAWGANQLLPPEEVAKLSRLAVDAGIPDQVQKLIDQHVAAAQLKIKSLGLDQTPSVQMLFSLLKK